MRAPRRARRGLIEDVTVSDRLLLYHHRQIETVALRLVSFNAQE